MRRKGHPSFPSAMTCCFFSSLKTLLMPREPIRTPIGVNVPGSSLAGFQVILISRIWATPEVGGAPLKRKVILTCAIMGSSWLNPPYPLDLHLHHLVADMRVRHRVREGGRLRGAHSRARARSYHREILAKSPRVSGSCRPNTPIRIFSPSIRVVCPT